MNCTDDGPFRVEKTEAGHWLTLDGKPISAAGHGHDYKKMMYDLADFGNWTWVRAQAHGQSRDQCACKPAPARPKA